MLNGLKSIILSLIVSLAFLYAEILLSAEHNKVRVADTLVCYS
jgi:hypothetical protein